MTSNSLASNYDDHRLTQNQMNELRATGRLSISYRGDNIQFQLARRSAPATPAPRSRGSGHRSGFSVDLLNYAQTIFPPRSYEQYDKVLG